MSNCQKKESADNVCFLVYNIYLRMMSELNMKQHSGESQETDETQAFILKSLNQPNPYIADTLLIFNSHNQKSLANKRSAIGFNKDNKHYTPAFIVPSEHDFLQPRDQILKQIFSEKIVEASRQKTLLLLPKPSSSFCSVCRQFFTDYLKHITHPVHKKNIESSKTQPLIEDLIRDMHSKKRSMPSFADSEILDLKKKKVKVEQGWEKREEAKLFKELSTCECEFAVSLLQH